MLVFAGLARANAGFDTHRDGIVVTMCDVSKRRGARACWQALLNAREAYGHADAPLRRSKDACGSFTVLRPTFRVCQLTRSDTLDFAGFAPGRASSDTLVDGIDVARDDVSKQRGVRACH